MVVIFRVGVAMLCLFAGMAGAQQPQWAGLRIANALEVGQASLRVELNGSAWSPHGLKAGEVSALRRLKPGRHQLSFSCVGMEKHTVRLTLKPGDQVTLLPHARPPPGSQRKVIGVIKLSTMDSGESRTATIIDLGSQARRLIEIKQMGETWTPLSLRRLEVQRFEIVQPRGYLPIRVGRQRLQSLPVFGRGNQVLVLYDGTNGRTESLFYRDRSWPKVDEQTQP